MSETPDWAVREILELEDKVRNKDAEIERLGHVIQCLEMRSRRWSVDIHELNQRLKVLQDAFQLAMDSNGFMVWTPGFKAALWGEEKS